MAKSNSGQFRKGQGATNTGRTRWKKGQSGNPGGRPKGKGLAQHIRSRTNDGFAIAEFMIRIIKGQIKGATVKDKLDAARFLAEYGFGKAQAHINVDVQGEVRETRRLEVVQQIATDPEAVDLSNQLLQKISERSKGVQT